MARSTTTRSPAGFGHLYGRFHSHFTSRAQHGDDAGFSLMEAIVAFTIFVIVSVATVYGVVNLVRLTSVTNSDAAASQLATQELEKMREQSAASGQIDSYLSTDGTAALQKVTLGGTTYTITPQIYPNPRHAGDPVCASVPSSASTATASATASATPTASPTWERKVTVTISWQTGNGNHSLRYDSVLAC